MKSRRRKVNTGQTSSGAGNQLLALSLFIMLLAFFIVLNAMSTFEEARVKPVISSIEGAFASKISQSGNEQPSIRSSSEQSEGEGDTIDKLKALFSSQIPDNDTTVSRSKGVIHVAVSWDDLEAAVMAIGQPEDAKTLKDDSRMKGYFLSLLVALLKDEGTGVPYRMDILLNTEENPARLQNTDPEKLRRAIRDLDTIAEKIEKTGLPQKLFSVGLDKGKKGMVDLYFRPHVPFNPLDGQENYNGEQ